MTRFKLWLWGILAILSIGVVASSVWFFTRQPATVYQGIASQFPAGSLVYVEHTDILNELERIRRDPLYLKTTPLNVGKDSGDLRYNHLHETLDLFTQVSRGAVAAALWDEHGQWEFLALAESDTQGQATFLEKAKNGHKGMTPEVIDQNTLRLDLPESSEHSKFKTLWIGTRGKFCAVSNEKSNLDLAVTPPQLSLRQDKAFETALKNSKVQDGAFVFVRLNDLIQKGEVFLKDENDETLKAHFSVSKDTESEVDGMKIAHALGIDALETLWWAQAYQDGQVLANGRVGLDPQVQGLIPGLLNADPIRLDQAAVPGDAILIIAGNVEPPTQLLNQVKTGLQEELGEPMIKKWETILAMGEAGMGVSLKQFLDLLGGEWMFALAPKGADIKDHKALYSQEVLDPAAVETLVDKVINQGKEVFQQDMAKEITKEERNGWMYWHVKGQKFVLALGEGRLYVCTDVTWLEDFQDGRLKEGPIAAGFTSRKEPGNFLMVAEPLFFLDLDKALGNECGEKETADCRKLLEGRPPVRVAIRKEGDGLAFHSEGSLPLAAVRALKALDEKEVPSGE